MKNVILILAAFSLLSLVVSSFAETQSNKIYVINNTNYKIQVCQEVEGKCEEINQHCVLQYDKGSSPFVDINLYDDGWKNLNRFFMDSQDTALRINHIWETDGKYFYRAKVKHINNGHKRCCKRIGRTRHLNHGNNNCN